jgi:MoxR-like ATPase
MENIKDILKGVYDNIELRRTIVPLFIGNPGASKSVQIREFARDRKVKLVPFVTSQRNPFEISGLAMPDRDTKRMSFWDFDTLLDMKDGDILFFDEVFNGNPTVLNACLTILEEREMISGKKLPDIMIVAAANPQGMVPLTPQIKERFVWYKFEFPKESWKRYMLNKYKMPDVVSQKLVTLINSEDFKRESNYNSARSIDKAVGMIISNVFTPYQHELLPILNTLIKNELTEDVKLSVVRVLAVGESIPWLEMVRIIKNNF